MSSMVDMGENIKWYTWLKYMIFNPNRRIETYCNKCTYFVSVDYSCKACYYLRKNLVTGEGVKHCHSCGWVNSNLHCPLYIENNTLKMHELMEGEGK